MNEIEQKIISKIHNQKTIFLHGEWGIGKTYFAKNALFDAIKANNKVLYIDSRIFDQDISAFDYVALFAKENKSRKAKFKNAGKTGSKVFLNSMIFGANSLLKTNIEYAKITNEVDLDIELKETIGKITLIIDELDRVTPDTLLKALNFINGISIINEDLQIIVIGNKPEMQSILSSRFGYSNKRDFLHKYFEDEYSLDDIANEYLKSMGGEIFKKINILESMSINSTPRNLERAVKLLKRVMTKYDGLFSDGIWYTAFYSELMDERIGFYGMQIYKQDKVDVRTDFKFWDKDKWSQFNLSTESFGERWINPMVDLNLNFGLSAFDEWVQKWKLPTGK